MTVSFGQYGSNENLPSSTGHACVHLCGQVLDTDKHYYFIKCSQAANISTPTPVLW